MPALDANSTYRRQQFWLKIDQSAGPDRCWPWRGCVRRDGYGHTSFGKSRSMTAHRKAFYYHYGFWPKACVLHSCDNRLCCNPAHLRAGTKLDNALDMLQRGRHGGLRLDAAAIRSAVGTCREVATRFGCSVSMVSLIRRNKKRNLGV